MLKERLLAIQIELKAHKSQFNKFGNYGYRSCEDILEALKPLLQKHGLFLTISDEIVQVGNRYYIKANVNLCSSEKDEKALEISAYAREEDIKKGMDPSQITGAASSYARKYALNGLFLIDDTKDADTQDNTKHINENVRKDNNQVKVVTEDSMEGELCDMKSRTVHSSKTNSDYTIYDYAISNDKGMTFETISSFEKEEAVVGDKMRFTGLTRKEYRGQMQISAKKVEIIERVITE